jgi:hypothetical protein
MAGTYAHIILVDSLCRQPDSIPDLPASIRHALKNYRPFCKLGAVGPDCPYAVQSTGATGYANLMHYLRTADFVRFAIPRIYGMNFGFCDTRKCIAWIFGYAAHLVTDLTIHPVISRKFGAYAASSRNRKRHRLCELNQDAYLFQRDFGSDIVGSDFLRFSEFGECAEGGNLHKLSRPIAALWAFCLNAYPRPETKKYVRLPKESLKLNVWYATFVKVFRDVLTKGNAFLQDQAIGYPHSSKVDAAYISDLPTASGGKITYDELFGDARENVRHAWRELALALDSNQPAQFTLPNANLDTGLADATGRPVFVV